MKIRALAPWFGGKRTLAPKVVELLGKHTQYFEPFCGSMAVLLAKPRSQKETVNDLHGDLNNLARVIADPVAAPKLYEQLCVAPMAEELLSQAKRELANKVESPEEGVTDAMIRRAYWYFLASWQGRNGTSGTSRIDYQIAVRWTKGGGSATVRFRNAVESIPAWHARLLNVVILKRDAFKIIGRFEDVKGTAIYCDPPYTKESRTGHHNNSSRYLHEFNHSKGLFGADDHERLAKILNAFQHARIVVSYYDCPRIRELYAGWNFHKHAMVKQLHAQNGRWQNENIVKQDAPEVLITNK